MNEGQIEGLPRNPREWASEDVERLAKSIQETPELLEARPLIVYQHGPKFIVLGGNLRFAALKKLKWKDAPCYLLPINTPVEKMKEIVIKDNGSFGKWDYDMLANEWDDLDLNGWGVPAWDPDSFGGSSYGDGGASNSGHIEGKDDDYDVDQKVEDRVKRGEIWALGPHRLMCGDATQVADIKRLMGGGREQTFG